MRGLPVDAVWRLLLQLAVVLLVAAAGGAAARRLGQPAALGQVVGGALVGPGTLGGLAPRWSRTWLPPGHAGPLLVVAALGAVTLLARAGSDIDRTALRDRAPQLPWLLLGATLPPLAVGYGLGLLLPGEFLGSTGDRTSFALVVATLTGISSPPMIAAVLDLLGLSRRSFAQVAMAAAVISSLVAWLVLGAATGSAASGGPAVAAGGAAAVAALVVLLRAPVRAAGRGVRRPARITLGLAVVALLAGLAGACGLDPVLGAFAGGLVVGSCEVVRVDVDEVLRPVAEHLLGPVFFVVAGLRVEPGRLGSPAVLGWTVLLVVAASAAKVLGAGLPWWAAGRPRSEALALGTVLNVRGSLGIVVAGVGLGGGVLGPTGYTAAVALALATTLPAAPVLRRLADRTRRSVSEAPPGPV